METITEITLTISDADIFFQWAYFNFNRYGEYGSAQDCFWEMRKGGKRFSTEEIYDMFLERKRNGKEINF